MSDSSVAKNGCQVDDRRVVVTGAGGFIGRHVLRFLTNSFTSVHALTGPGDRPLDLNVSSSEVEIRDEQQLADAMPPADVVVHLAGPPAVRDSFAAPQLFADVHVSGTANVLQVAAQRGVNRFVYLSSAEVYGQPIKNPVDETHRLMARSPYGAAKIGAERFVESFTRFSDMSAVVLRPFSIYGPGQTTGSLLATILRQLSEGSRVELADLRPVRDYLFVADLSSAIAAACAAPIDGCAILNIGSGNGTSVEELARNAAAVLDMDADVVQRRDSDRPSAANIVELVADCRMANEILAWKPTVDLLSGLRLTAALAESGA